MSNQCWRPHARVPRTRHSTLAACLALAPVACYSPRARSASPTTPSMQNAAVVVLALLFSPADAFVLPASRAIAPVHIAGVPWRSSPCRSPVPGPLACARALRALLSTNIAAHVTIWPDSIHLSCIWQARWLTTRRRSRPTSRSSTRPALRGPVTASAALSSCRCKNSTPHEGARNASHQGLHAGRRRADGQGPADR